MFLNAKNYFTSNIFIKALGIISIPITTRYLSPSDFGNVSLFTIYVTVASIILPLNSHASIGRYYFEKNTNFEKFVSTSVWLSLFFSIFVSIIFLFFFAPFLKLGEFGLWFYLLVICNAFTNISTSVFMQIHEPANNSLLIAKRSITTGLLQFVLNIIIVIFSPPPKWEFVIVGMALTSLLSNIYFFKFIKNYIRLTFEFSYIKYITKFSIPLLPYALSGVVLSQIDRIMIMKNSNSADTGIYSLAVSLAMMVVFVGDSINRAWMPEYFKHMDNKDYHIHDNEVSKNLRYWTFFSVTFILLFFEPAKLIIGNKYQLALDLVPIVIFGYLFEFYFTIYGRNIGYSKKTIYSSIILILSGVVNIALNYFTLNKYGYKIASVNTLISYLSLFLMAFFVSKFVIKLHTFSVLKLVPSFFTLLCSLILFYLIEFFELNFIFSFSLKFIILVFILYIFYSSELKNIFFKVRDLITR